MNWSIYWNKLNWCKGSQRSRKLFGYGWKRSRSGGTFQQPGLFVLRMQLVKMCWQPLFIPLNKSMLCVPSRLCVLFCCVFCFFFSVLKCLLINLGQKEEQMQLFKWMNLITYAYCTSGAFSSGVDGGIVFVRPRCFPLPPRRKWHQVSIWRSRLWVTFDSSLSYDGHDWATVSSHRGICWETIRKSHAGNFGAPQGCV